MIVLVSIIIKIRQADTVVIVFRSKQLIFEDLLSFQYLQMVYYVPV